MKALKIIGKISFCLLCAISFIIGILNIHFVYFVESTTTGTNYIDDQSPVDIEDIKEAGTLSEEEILRYENRKLFDLSYYSNEKDNGIELQEAKINFFTDTTLTTASCRSTGMQYIGDFETYTTEVTSEEEAQQGIREDFYYYDTTNMVSWSGGNLQTTLNRNAKLIIKLDGEPYQIQLTGQYNYTSKERQWWTLWLWEKETKHTVFYDWGDVFADMMTAVKTNNQGYGSCYIVLDLSKYFTLYKFDGNKFVENDVADEVFTYAVCKINFYENGATSSSQSLFGLIEGNANYGTATDTEIEFWQERVVYTLSTKFLNYRYSEVYGGHFATIRQDIFNKLVKMPRAKVSFKINLSDEFLMDNNYKLIGFDYSAFEGVRVDTVSITGSGNFYILDNAFAKTSIQQLQHSKAINLIISDNAFDSAYKEVVV